MVSMTSHLPRTAPFSSITDVNVCDPSSAPHLNKSTVNQMGVKLYIWIDACFAPSTPKSRFFGTILKTGGLGAAV